STSSTPSRVGRTPRLGRAVFEKPEAPATPTLIAVIEPDLLDAPDDPLAAALTRLDAAVAADRRRSDDALAAVKASVSGDLQRADEVERELEALAKEFHPLYTKYTGMTATPVWTKVWASSQFARDRGQTLDRLFKIVKDVLEHTPKSLMELRA